MAEDPRPPLYERPELPFDRKGTALARAGRWSAVGLEFGAIVVLFFLGGQALDAKLGTAPWLTVTGSLFGVAAGIYLLIRAALTEEQRASQGPERGDR